MRLTTTSRPLLPLEIDVFFDLELHGTRIYLVFCFPLEDTEGKHPSQVQMMLLQALAQFPLTETKERFLLALDLVEQALTAAEREMLKTISTSAIDELQLAPKIGCCFPVVLEFDCQEGNFLTALQDARAEFENDSPEEFLTQFGLILANTVSDNDCAIH